MALQSKSGGALGSTVAASIIQDNIFQ